MSAKDDIEKVLREIHVLFSKAEPYEGSRVRVVVNKNDMLDLLKKLNDAMYGMMDEYELTQASRDKAEREQKKKGDEIVLEAQRKAEDVYAASIMYTDNALNEIQNIMKKASEQIEQIEKDTRKSIDKETRIVRNNQSELKGQLHDLIDTQKYMRIIEEENRRIAKEKQREKDGVDFADVKDYAAEVQPEIRVNTDYFEKRDELLGSDIPIIRGGASDDLDALNGLSDADYARQHDRGEAGEAAGGNISAKAGASDTNSDVSLDDVPNEEDLMKVALEETRDLDDKIGVPKKDYDWSAAEREEKRQQSSVDRVLRIFGRRS